jgi:type II secretory pathway pseudopilin PulG
MTLIEVLITLTITILIMAALFSFSLGVQKGGIKTRKAAESGQAVEIALTQLRNELAGARWIGFIGGNLKYESVRNDMRWTLELGDRQLTRVLEDNIDTQQVVLARDIDAFSFVLPDPGKRILQVTVRSGDFELSDSIFLRNWRGGEYPDWHASVWYVVGDRVKHNDERWEAILNSKGAGGGSEPGVVLEGETPHWNLLP